MFEDILSGLLVKSGLYITKLVVRQADRKTVYTQNYFPPLDSMGGGRRIIRMENFILEKPFKNKIGGGKMKKSTQKLMLVVALLLVAICVLAACDETGGGSISVKYDNTHVISEGDDLESVKPYLTVTYTDAEGNSQQITDYKLSGKLVSGDCQLTVSYNGYTAKVTVNVAEISGGTLRVEFDESHVFHEGDDLEMVKDYLIVKYVAADGLSGEITDYTLSGYLEPGECELTVRYNGITATVTVHVASKSNEHIWAVFEGDDLVICEGDDLEKVRSCLSVTYTDAEGNTVQIEDYALNGQIVGGECELTVTYNGLTTCVQILVAYKPTLWVESEGYFFHVDDEPEKVKEGLRVYYKETDGKLRDIYDYELIGTLTQGACELTVAYNGLTAKVIVDVVANNSLMVKRRDDDIAIYDTDDLFSIRGLLYVMYTDSNGNSDAVYDYTLEGTVAFGKCELTVTYNDLSTKIIVDVLHQRSLSVELEEGCFFHENDNLETVKKHLTVTYTDEQNVSKQITDFRLQGELKSGKCRISVIYDYNAYECVSNVVYVNVVSNNSLLVMVNKDAVIHPDEKLEVVKEWLTVIYTDSNGKSNVVNDYALDGSLYLADSYLTVTYKGITQEVRITVSCNHVFSEWIVEPATCAKHGTQLRWCTMCGYKEEQELSQLTHTLTHHDASAATCQTEGNVEYWYCSGCETYFGDEKGEKVLDSSSVILSKAHVYDTWVEEVPATCTKTGTKGHQYCSVCQKNYDVEGNEIEDLTLPLAHVFGNWVYEIPATCIENGTKGYQYCSVCQKYYDVEGLEIQDFTIPKVDHKPSDWIEDEYATCTVNGSKHKECTVCHETLETATIPAAHIFGDWVEEVPASCSIGFVGRKMCMRCYGYFDADENQIHDLVIPAVHSPGDWIVDMEATCTSMGQKHRECTVCNEYLDRTYFYAEHEFEEWVNEVPVTCTQSGNKGYQYCTSCRKYYDATGAAVEYRDLIIPAEGHKAGTDWIVDVEANCYEEGSKHKECTVCHGVAVTETIPIAHSCGSWVEKVSATCTEDGQVAHYTCTICGTNLDKNYNKLNSLVIPATGHSCKNGYCSVCNWEEQSEGLAYTLSSDGTYYIVSCGTCTDSKVIIPTKHEGLPVKAIGDEAFKDCTTITSVVIPSCITSIGKSAFSDCEYLREVYISDLVAWCNITFGGNNSSNPLYEAGRLFLNGECVDNLVIPSTITEIKPYTFCGIAVSNIQISEGVTVIGNSAFVEGLVHRGIFADATITIPASVTSIGDNAFSDRENTRNITICNNSQLKSIGAYAFSHMPFLENVTFGENSKLESIGDYAFYIAGQKLTNIAIPDSVTSIGKGAFSWCQSLTNITIPRGVTSIGEEAFSGCNGLTSVTFADNCQLATIGEEAFAYCTGLTSVTIPDSVTSIGLGTFSGCSGLTSITIPFVGAKAGVTSSDTYQYPFGYIFGTKSYTNSTSTTIRQYYYGDSTSDTTYSDYCIPSSLKTVTFTGDKLLYGAFSNCSSLTSIVLTDSVTSIGGRAFGGCSGLESVTIPAGVTSISEYAFLNCTALTEIKFNAMNCDDLSSGAYAFCNVGQNGDGIKVTIGKNVQKIPAHLFASDNYSKLSKLLEVVFEDGAVCTSIGYAAFSNIGLTSVTIPASVTSIGNSAFSNCKSLQDVTIGNSVESIGFSAFSGCSELASITIPDSVQSIESYAFQYCTGLQSVTIGKSVKSFGKNAFASCTALTEINFNATNANYLDNDNRVFSYAGQGGDGIEVTIGANVQNVPDHLFCAAWQDSECAPKITNVVFEEGSVCTGIDTGSFYNCISLKSIVISDSITSIGFEAFRGCSSLTSVIFGKNSQLDSIGSSAFYGCSDLASFTIPESVTSIYNSFCGCSSLASIVIPASVTLIDSQAFSSCDSLASITVAEGNSVYHSEGNCIIKTETKTLVVGCPKSIIPTDGSVTSIGFAAFIGFSNLTNIDIPDSVTSIGKYAFSGCSSLTSIVIPSGVTSIGGGAFTGCSSLTSVKIPYGVTSIDYDTFEGCSNLTSIEIPSSVRSIGNRAFGGCSSLESIVVPYGVKSIGDLAFYNCSNLTSVVFDENSQLTSLGGRAFSGCSSLKSIVIPSNVTSIGYMAFNGCSSLTSIVIPSSVTSINYDSFTGCSNLTIYCEAESQPSGWSSQWNHSNCPVIWGYVEEEQ